jgi:translation initiation factor RLI1
MNKEEIKQGIHDLLKDLNQNVVIAYKKEGMAFGNERYSSWRKKVTKFLDQFLPNEKIRFNLSVVMSSEKNQRGCTPFISTPPDFA